MYDIVSRSDIVCVSEIGQSTVYVIVSIALIQSVCRTYSLTLTLTPTLRTTSHRTKEENVQMKVS